MKISMHKCHIKINIFAYVIWNLKVPWEVELIYLGLLDHIEHSKNRNNEKNKKASHRMKCLSKTVHRATDLFTNSTKERRNINS